MTILAVGDVTRNLVVKDRGPGPRSFRATGTDAVILDVHGYFLTLEQAVTSAIMQRNTISSLHLWVLRRYPRVTGMKLETQLELGNRSLLRRC